MRGQADPWVGISSRTSRGNELKASVGSHQHAVVGIHSEVLADSLVVSLASKFPTFSSLRMLMRAAKAPSALPMALCVSWLRDRLTIAPNAS